MTPEEFSKSIRALLPGGLEDNLGERYRNIIWYTADDIVKGCDTDWTTNLGFIKIGEFTRAEGESAFGLWFGNDWNRPIVTLSSGENNGSQLWPITDNIQQFFSEPSRFLNTKHIRNLQANDEWKQQYPSIWPNKNRKNLEIEFLKTAEFAREFSTQKDYLDIHKTILGSISQLSTKSSIALVFSPNFDISDFEQWIKLYNSIITINNGNAFNGIIQLEVAEHLYSNLHAGKVGYPFRFIMMIKFLHDRLLPRVKVANINTRSLIHLRIKNLKNIIKLTMSRMKKNDPGMFKNAVQNGFDFKEYQIDL